MVRDYARGRSDVDLRIVNVSPRWREIDDLRVWRRVVLGGATMLWHVCLVIWRLMSGCRVVHITTPGQLSIFRDIVIIAVAKVFGVKTLYNIRFGRIPEIAQQNTGEWRWIARAMQMVHQVIVIDEATETAVRQYLPDVNLIRVPNCVDIAGMPVPEPIERTQKTVMYLGWVIPTKGMDELVQAWSALRPQGWQLQIVGPGDAMYQQALVERHRPEGIEFAGERSHQEAMQIMAASTLFVLPSYTEGFPNVVVEAMALGRPIVATTVGAIPELLGDGCGTLVPPQDADALKQALAAVMADTNACREMGGRARERAQTRYALPAVFDHLVTLWRAAAAA